MSEENVETVRAINDAYNRGDFDAVREKAEPEFVLIPAGAQPPIKGADKVREWMEDYRRLRVPGSRTSGASRGRKQGSGSGTLAEFRGAGSGIEIEVLAWVVWTFNEAGRTIKLEIYLDHEKADAFKAAGLSE